MRLLALAASTLCLISSVVTSPLDAATVDNVTVSTLNQTVTDPVTEGHDINLIRPFSHFALILDDNFGHISRPLLALRHPITQTYNLHSPRPPPEDLGVGYIHTPFPRQDEASIQLHQKRGRIDNITLSQVFRPPLCTEGDGLYQYTSLILHCWAWDKKLDRYTRNQVPSELRGDDIVSVEAFPSSDTPSSRRGNAFPGPTMQLARPGFVDVLEEWLTEGLPANMNLLAVLNNASAARAVFGNSLADGGACEGVDLATALQARPDGPG
ncbi:hypothetical protein LA080_001902 [Diaporthe eres]|nr:hypothetical protein LA080_001902 [Diaporthe eres]